MNNPVRNDVSLLLVALHDDTYLDDIMLGVTGICGGRVVVIDGTISNENLTQNIPMFAHLMGMTGNRGCKILLAAATVEQPVTQLLTLLEQAGIDFVGDSLGEIHCLKVCESVLIENVDI